MVQFVKVSKWLNSHSYWIKCKKLHFFSEIFRALACFFCLFFYDILFTHFGIFKFAFPWIYPIFSFFIDFTINIGGSISSQRELVWYNFCLVCNMRLQRFDEGMSFDTSYLKDLNIGWSMFHHVFPF